MIGLKRLALLTHGAPPRNVLEAALRAKWGGGGASYEKTVGPAPIISIADAKKKPAKSLIVGMEPIQDLHGYDSPWPAGGGKNVLPSPTSIDPSGSTTITNNNGVLTIISTGAGQSIINIPAFTFAASGQKIELLNSFTNATVRFYNGDTQIDYFSLNTANRVISASSLSLLQGQTIDNYRIQLNGATSGTLGIMITPDADAALSAFSPYENLCPISGRTGVAVERTGTNLFDATSYPLTSGYINSSDGSVSAGGTSASKTVDYIPCGFLAGGAITINHRPGYGYSPGIAFYDADKTFISGVANNGSTSTDAWSMSVPSAAQYMRITVPYGQENIQIELGSTASDYSAYSGASYPVAFPDGQTVYGGTVDVVSGVLTVTMAQIASYNGEALPGKWISDRDVYAEGTFPTTGAQVVYELATPITYQLTPQQIQLLKGSNTLWSDADDLTLTYIGTEPEEE